MAGLDEIKTARATQATARNGIPKTLDDAIKASGADMDRLVDFVHGELIANETFIGRSALQEQLYGGTAKNTSGRLLSGIVTALEAWNFRHESHRVPLDALRPLVIAAGENAKGR